MSHQLGQTFGANANMLTTHWSMVRGLAVDATGHREAMEQFARRYWPAVYSFIRMKGHRPDEAEDLTQSFLVDLIKRNPFDALSASQGRFRSWLRACLQNFLRTEWRKAGRQKRGGRAEHLSIDRDLGEGWFDACRSQEVTPEVAFDRSWATSLLERAFHDLQRSYRRDGRTELIEALLPVIAGAERRPSYAEVAARLGIPEAHARVAAFRMRRRLQALIREEVASTVSSPDEVDSELAALFGVFADPGA